ncbi:hypothetical protein IWX46DRAFT_230084 [Phyllosticta citricarpa]|uniref:Uncharacterized protein n=1 Tax=Phyllosticta citricarpa TaxID=55181 RepID=A0ABR1MNW9_9PEZI
MPMQITNDERCGNPDALDHLLHQVASKRRRSLPQGNQIGAHEAPRADEAQGARARGVKHHATALEGVERGKGSVLEVGNGVCDGGRGGVVEGRSGGRAARRRGDLRRRLLQRGADGLDGRCGGRGRDGERCQLAAQRGEERRDLVNVGEKGIGGVRGAACCCSAWSKKGKERKRKHNGEKKEAHGEVSVVDAEVLRVEDDGGSQLPDAVTER